MSIADLSAAALELLQKFSIDVKEFTKARVRYGKVQAELLSGEGELSKTITTVSSSSVLAEESGETTNLDFSSEKVLEQLNEAWQEYFTLMQSNFRKVSTTLVDEMLEKMQNRVSATERAEKLNELCAFGEKWYVRNEKYFSFPNTEKLVLIVEEALDSSSRVMRLLGAQLTRICAADVMFTRCFFSRGGSGLIGMCLDRENATELEYGLNMCSRLIELYESDPKAYPKFPYGWMYRIGALLDVQDPVPNVPPKRKSQAIRIAVKLLRQFPAMSTAASLHTILLRCCIQKSAATLDEIQSILRVILELFDRVETRQYIRCGDLDILYAPFLYSNDKSSDERIALMNGAKDVIAMLMRSWIGIIWLSSETRGLRAIIDILHLPGDLDCKMVILSLFNKVLFQLAPHRGISLMEKWNGLENQRNASAEVETGIHDGCTGFMGGGESSQLLGESGKNVVCFDAMLGELVESQEEFVPTTKAIGYHVLDPLLGRVLLLLSYHGLPLALVSIIQNGSTSRVLTVTTSSLLQDMLVLMDTVLPIHPVKKLHTALNKAVGRLAEEGDLSFGGGLTSRLFQQCKVGKDIKVSSSATATADNMITTERINSLSSTTLATYELGSLEVDDVAFEQLLLETNVERANSFVGWNYDLLLLLIQGPLRSLPRFKWVMNHTHFFHKLITFYLPTLDSQVQKFVSLRPEECTPQVSVFGLGLLDLFLSTPQGVQILDNFDFTTALANSIQEVIDGNPRILNRQRVGSRVGQTLLRMVGRYSLSANGLMTMKEHNMFFIINNIFTQLSGERVTNSSGDDTLQDVCLQLLEYLYIGAVPNYGVCEEIRQTCRSALCNDANAIRLCAANQLRKALWRDLSTSMRWGIETLVQALHDDYYNVVETAFKLLLSICLCSDEALDYLISLSPTVLMESDVIRDHAQQLSLNMLLYCIVGRPSGFRFLQCYGWVEEELLRWEETESAHHVVLIERMQSGEPVDTAIDFREGMSGRWRQQQHHGRTLSDPLASLYRTAVLTPTVSASRTASAGTTTTSGFFPTHFAAVLCKSNEGCTLFKHSDLWQRSIKRILDQSLPPDIVYDDGTDGRSETSDEEGDDADEAERALGEEDPSFWGRLGVKADAAAATRRAEARQLHLLRKGCLPSSQSARLLSASRGYKPAAQSYLLDCVGDIAELKDAILCVCHAASSDTGFALVRTVPGLQKRLIALTQFAAIVTVRSVCLLGACLLARSKRSAELLSSMSFYVLNAKNAYTSADGVPYSVALAYLKPSKWTSLGRRTNHAKMSSHFAHIQENDSTGDGNSICAVLERVSNETAVNPQSRRIWDQVSALCNPVSREGAKNRLYALMKHQPQVFVEPQMRRMLMDAALTFRMRHTERKFIADLLENAPLTKGKTTSRRVTYVTLHPQWK
ncbi:Rapamycin-insensitive companion of mTOR [Trypanosoma melophagium]|uniref:Rapamycin-insensitive companion of mTOR n=1 Tax=Trypanosoma melophagium TaxID=715481 RepID=UPI00351A7CFB|nr:Rapamycin-insensitive companion of mTOR [Trypanosoma melophagium]